MKTRVLRRGSVKGAYSPSSNHPFYGWHRLWGEAPACLGVHRRRECEDFAHRDEGIRANGERGAKRGGLPVPMLASTSPQSLLPPSRHANMVRIFPVCRRLCWRRPPRKASYLRRGTPTWSGFSRPPGAREGKNRKNPDLPLAVGPDFFCVPGMVQVLRVKVPSRVFTAKCSEPQAENSNV